LLLPAVQPGSSIMPGKVNPVIAEALIQACAQVIGNDTAISLGGILGNFQLNTMLPLIARNLIEQIRLLSRASRVFSQKLLRGIEAQRESISAQLGRSLALAAALTPAIGYDRAAKIAQKAHATGKTILEIAKEEEVLPSEELVKLLDPQRLVAARDRSQSA
jgi:fumarate hydratase, class II